MLIEGISVNLSWIQTIKEKLLRNIVQPYYEQSHNIYCHQHYSDDFKVLYRDILYILELENIYTNEKQAFSRLFLKSTIAYDLLELSIEAYNNDIRYQDYFILQNVNNQTLICVSLPSIPLQYFDFENMYRPYKSILITLNKLVINGETLNLNHKISIDNLTYYDLLNGTWEQRWGKTYNTTALTQTKQKLVEFYISKLELFEILEYSKYCLHSKGIKQLLKPNFFYLKLKTHPLSIDTIFLWKMFKKTLVLAE